MLVLKSPQPGSSELDYVRRALGQGELVVVPTDTVYGIAALATDEAAVARMYAQKGRDASQPTAVIFTSVADVREQLPSLGHRANFALQALLPGPWTLVLDNPDEAMPWLTGGTPGPLGVRVPAGALDLPPIAASSANRTGEPTVESIADLDPALVAELCCAIDGGVLARGAESTVLDLVEWERGGEVRVLRDTARRAGQALAVLANAPL
jgi:L-threonylcarbamoyladenylate synthase